MEMYKALGRPSMMMCEGRDWLRTWLTGEVSSEFRLWRVWAVVCVLPKGGAGGGGGAVIVVDDGCVGYGDTFGVGGRVV